MEILAEESVNNEDGQNIMENPLFNLNVLEIVFGYCNKPTLLKCRQVCQIWNEEALRVLEKNRATALLKGKEGIDAFIKCMKSSSNHPYTSFYIELPQEEGSPEDESIYELLDNLKNRLENLKFEYQPQQPIEDYQGENLEPSGHKISHLKPLTLPLLDSLHLFSTNIFPPDTTNGVHQMPKLFTNLMTPNLINLSVQHLYDTDCSEAVIALINSSQNQILCLKFPCNDFPKISGQVNLSHLRELDVCDLFHGSFATNETIQCIIQSCPNLQKLSIELGCRVTFENIYKLFQTLSHSIKHLKLIIQDRNLLSRTIQRVNFYFPMMHKLQSLFLRFTNPGLVYYIDELPQLKSLELETPWTRKVRGNIFPGIEEKNYDKLKMLNLSEKLTVNDVQKISKLFPNLKTLCASFEGDESISEVFKILRNLEGLIIDRNSSITDSGVCGIDQEDMNKLNELQKDDKNINLMEQIQQMKKKPHIGNLKQLKTLKLVQAGLSWKSLAFGITSLEQIESLAVQTKVLKMHNNIDLRDNDIIPCVLSEELERLKHLTIWIRRNAERLSELDLEYLKSAYSQWDITVTLQTVCGVA